VSDKVEANQHVEPCLGCGEETAIGSVFFSDRKVIEDPDGTRSYLCSSCVGRLRSAGYHEDAIDVGSVAVLAMIGVNRAGS
jgi:hypothetical protein